MWALIELTHQKLIVGACYRPPTYSSTFVNELHDATNIVSSRFPTLPLFLLGDFNIPNITWNSEPPLMHPVSSLAKEFLDFCSVFSFTQVVKQPTRITQSAANTLDLVLSSRSDFISDITYLPGLSDHALLSFHVNLSRPLAPKKSKTFRNYKKANFEAINNELSAFLDIFLEDFNLRSVQANWNLYLAKVNELTNKYIPTYTVRHNRNAPWYNLHIKRLSNKKKRLFKSAKRSSNDRWIPYKQAADEYVSAVKKAKEEFQQQTLPLMLTTDTKKFWRVINPKDDNKIILIDDTDNVIPSNLCASTLNECFIRNFSESADPSLPFVHSYDYAVMFPILIEPAGVEHLLRSLKPSSAPGCDLVNPKFLKSTSVYSSIILTKIFQQSLDNGFLPAEWKVGKVIPLHKSGNKTSALNYRPISLTSIPCKILEHILFSNLANFLESNSFFTFAQHGFRKTYSCETQLVSFMHKMNIILDHSSSADCIFLDFSKAFDKVCHKLLLYKLRQLNLDHKLLTWLEFFLINRSQFVSANDLTSEPRSVHSGVPQGSVLGPLLFLIYINDLASTVSSHIHLFADDCVLFREITCDNDIICLQSDLNAISVWCEAWRMELNINKCKLMHVSRKPCQLPKYCLNNIPLDPVSSYKYLGIHISHDLTWTAHTTYVINNANRMLGYLRRNFARASSSLKLLLYTTLIRSKLEYAASVWDPSQENLINSLEMVQNNSVRFILSNYNRTASISSMKSSLSLPSLASRRKAFRLSLFHKLFYHSHLHDELILPPQYISSRFDHANKVGIPSARTNAFFQSFLPRTSDEWNRLPASIATIEDSHHFKNALANIV